MLDIPTKIKYTIYKLTVRNVKNEKGGECNVGKKYENEEFLQYLELDSPFTTAGRENFVSGLEAVTLYDATQQASTQTTQTTQTNTAYDESMTYDMLRQQDIQIPQEIDTVLPAA